MHHPIKKSLSRTLIALAASLGMSSALAGDHKGPPAAGMEVMQKQMALMKPELQAKVKALSPEIKGFLAHVAAKHTRRSDKITMAQVMQEVMVEFQTMSMAIAMEDGELAADAGRRLANHRLPRGGLLPYLPLEKVNSQDLSVLPAMEAAVEGGSIQVAEAAEKGDFVAAAGHLGDVMRGCVACHQHFRGQPGATSLLRQ